MTSIALFEPGKKKNHIAQLWDAFTREFQVSKIDSYRLPSNYTKTPDEQSLLAAHLVSRLRSEQLKRRYGYGQSLWGSIRAHQEINKKSRGTKVYAKQIHHLRAELAATGANIASSWCPLKHPRLLFRLAAQLNCTPLLHFEDAPFPGFFVADTKGINMGNSLSDDPHDYQQFGAHGDSAIEALKSSIQERAPISKSIASRMGIRSSSTIPENFIYCPLQVDEDTQLINYGGWCDSVLKFIDSIYTASRFLPNDWSVVIREHPSSKRSFTKKLLKLADDKFVLDNTGSSLERVKRCRAIATINSSVGLHGYLFDKSVITLGRAMWSFGHMAIEAKCPVHLAELFASPDSWSHSIQERKAFLDYLTKFELMPLPKLEGGTARFCPKAKAILDRKVAEAANLIPEN